MLPGVNSPGLPGSHTPHVKLQNYLTLMYSCHDRLHQ